MKAWQVFEIVRVAVRIAKFDGEKIFAKRESYEAGLPHPVVSVRLIGLYSTDGKDS